MAGRYDEKVKAILGQEIWQMLERSVKNGEVDARRMQDIAYKLHEEVGGGHSVDHCSQDSLTAVLC